MRRCEKLLISEPVAAEVHGALLPGLPDEVATLCLCRLPLRILMGVCKSWRKQALHQSSSTYFQFLRLSLGLPNYSCPYVLIRRKDGNFRWFAFDPLLSSWRELPPMPDGVDFQLSSPGMIGVKHSVQCVSSKTKLIVVAGSKARINLNVSSMSSDQRVQLEPALDSPLVFDTKTCKWTRGRPFTIPRRWCACGMLNENKLYLASGCRTEWNCDLSKSAEMYDVEREEWQPMGKLASSKFSSEAITALNVGGQLYMVSGRGVFAREGVVYSPETGEWREMPCGLRDGWSGQCAASNGRLYGLEESCGKLKVYDPVLDRWKVILQNERLRDVQGMVGRGGKLCGYYVAMPKRRSVGESGERDVKETPEGISFLRIIDVSLSEDHARLYDDDVEMPEKGGEVVALQLLERFVTPSPASI